MYIIQSPSNKPEPVTYYSINTLLSMCVFVRFFVYKTASFVRQNHRQQLIQILMKINKSVVLKILKPGYVYRAQI